MAPTTPGAVDAQKVVSMWKKGQDAQMRLVRNFAVNQAFNAGDQWIKADRGGSLVQVERDPDRVQLTVNRVASAVRRIMAKIHKRPLTWDVPPPAADDASVRKSKMAEAELSSARDRMGWEEIRRECDLVTFLGGTGVLCIDWDGSAGPKITETDDGKKVGAGDAVVTVSSISQFVVEPGSRNGRRARWCIRVVALPPEEVRDTFGLKETPKADALGVSSYAVADLTRSSDSALPPDLTIVYRYYRRPAGDGDKGEVAVVVGNKVVRSAPWPYPFKDHLPIAVQRESIIPSLWMGDTILSSAVPIQAAYNQVWSSLVEHTKLCGFAMGFIPNGTADLIEEIEDMPGAWYSVATGADGGTPAYVSPPQLPQWEIEQPGMLRREMDDLLNDGEISRGAAPSNIESGLGVSILVEQGDTPAMQLAIGSADAWSDIASDYLELCAQNVTETRKAVLYEEGMPLEDVPWKGSDLKGCTRARVPYDAVIPKSRAAQQAFAMELWDRKLVEDPEKIAEIGDLPDKESFIAAVDEDVAKAKRENADMAMGQPGYLQTFDNHETHIRVHNRFRKTRRYQLLDDQSRTRIDAHVEEHELAARADQVEVAAEEETSPLGVAPPLASEADLALALSGLDPAMDPSTAPVDGMGDPAAMIAGGL